MPSVWLSRRTGRPMWYIGGRTAKELKTFIHISIFSSMNLLALVLSKTFYNLLVQSHCSSWSCLIPTLIHSCTLNSNLYHPSTGSCLTLLRIYQLELSNTKMFHSEMPNSCAQFIHRLSHFCAQFLGCLTLVWLQSPFAYMLSIASLVSHHSSSINQAFNQKMPIQYITISPLLKHVVAP